MPCYERRHIGRRCVCRVHARYKSAYEPSRTPDTDDLDIRFGKSEVSSLSFVDLDLLRRSDRSECCAYRHHSCGRRGGNGGTISAASLQGGRANESIRWIITKGNEAATEAVRSEIVAGIDSTRTRTARGRTWNQDVCRLRRETVTAALCRDVEIQYRGSEHTYRLGELGTTCSLQRRGEQTEIPINHPVTSREPRRGLLLRISQ